MKKSISIIIAMVLVLAMLSGCAAAPASTPAPAPAPTPAPAPAPAPAASGLKDGSYKAMQEKADNYGWKGQIAIEVKEGKIGSVDFDYVNNDNKLKSEDQGYIKAMEDKTKINLANVMVDLEKALVSSQDVAAVNAVTGATSTSNDFKALAELALKDAK